MSFFKSIDELGFKKPEAGVHLDLGNEKVVDALKEQQHGWERTKLERIKEVIEAAGLENTETTEEGYILVAAINRLAVLDPTVDHPETLGEAISEYEEALYSEEALKILLRTGDITATELGDRIHQIYKSVFLARPLTIESTLTNIAGLIEEEGGR